MSFDLCQHHQRQHSREGDPQTNDNAPHERVLRTIHMSLLFRYAIKRLAGLATSVATESASIWKRSAETNFPADNFAAS
jgi:hypothetical protein